YIRMRTKPRSLPRKRDDNFHSATSVSKGRPPCLPAVRRRSVTCSAYGQDPVPALSTTTICHLQRVRTGPRACPPCCRELSRISPPWIATSYGAFVPSRPYRSFNLTTSSRC